MSKAKPFQLLPGSGMSLEIKLADNKVFTFGAIVNRDDAFDSLIQAGIEQNLAWATGSASPSEAPPTLRRRGSSKINNFTWASDFVDSD